MKVCTHLLVAFHSLASVLASAWLLPVWRAEVPLVSADAAPNGELGANSLQGSAPVARGAEHGARRSGDGAERTNTRRNTRMQKNVSLDRTGGGEREGDGAPGPFPEAAQPPDNTVGHNPEQGRPPADHQTPVSRPAADRRKYTVFVCGGAVVPPPPLKVTRGFSEGPTGPLCPGAPHGSV